MKFNKIQKCIRQIILICLCILLAGCSASEPAQVEQDVIIESTPTQTAPTAASELPTQQPDPNQEPNYCIEAAQELLAASIPPKATEKEIALQIYNYLIANTYFSEPIGLDIWRYRSEQKIPPTYVENRSLSPILFGVGSCEDFAAAMVILLRQCDIDAVYVAGYTLSFKGEYTDHAWVVANISGEWYHFDPQLEQNIFFGGRIPYRFFMASDEEMLRDHLWGESLIHYCGDLATDKEIERIRSEFTPPPCPAAAQRPDEAIVGIPQKPDIEALLKHIEEEKASKPNLEDICLNTEPPVLVKAQPLVGLN